MKIIKILAKINYQEVFDKFFNDNPNILSQYDRHEPYNPPDPRAAKLAMESVYSYDEIKELVDRFPEYNDKDLYHCAEALRWGLSISTLDKFYQLHIAKNGKK